MNLCLQLSVTSESRACLVFAVLAFLGVAEAGTCYDQCLALPGGSKCYTNVADGGCCAADGIYSTNDSCAVCNWRPVGNPTRWVCDGCYSDDSPCENMPRAVKTESVCQENECSGGCLRNGQCDYAMNESTCLLTGRGEWTFCQSCPMSLWKMCSWASICFGHCEQGCCSNDDTSCPSEPYELRLSGDCSVCARIGDHCHECFSQSRCSTAYDPLRPMPFPGDPAPTDTPSGVPTLTPLPLPTPLPTSSPSLAEHLLVATASPTAAESAAATAEPPLGDELSSTTVRAAFGQLSAILCVAASVLGVGRLSLVTLMQ